jgi:hypothetical protein
VTFSDDVDAAVLTCGSFRANRLRGHGQGRGQGAVGTRTGAYTCCAQGQGQQLRGRLAECVENDEFTVTACVDASDDDDGRVTVRMLPKNDLKNAAT